MVDQKDHHSSSTGRQARPHPLGQHDLIDPLRPVVQGSLLSAAVTHPWAMFPPLLNVGQIFSLPHRQTGHGPISTYRSMRPSVSRFGLAVRR